MERATALPRFLGSHWIFDGYGAARERLADVDRLRRALDELPALLGLRKVSAPQTFQHGEDGALSCAGIVLIAESHFSLHAFPAEGALHGDLFSCRAFDVDVARRYLKDQYGFREFREQLHDRRGGEHGELDLPHDGG